jgi:signal recognition particle subunit SRP19
VAREREDRLVIWPIYFNSNATKKVGRKLRKELCVADPKVEEIYTVCKKLGLSPEMQDEKVHPTSEGSGKGRVMVRRAKKKTSVLNDIGSSLVKSRR